MTTTKTTKKQKRARTGRRFDKLVTFYTAQMDHTDETVRTDAARHLKDILLHVEQVAERRQARIARAKEARQDNPLPTDPAALEATIAKLQALATGGAL
jgi:hypothetical protein